VSRLSYIFLSNIRNASRSQKLYLQETSALTEVLLRIEDALEVRDIEGIRNFVAFGPSSKLKSTLENCQDLLASLKISLEKAAEDGSQFARLRSSLKWPFGEKVLEFGERLDLVLWETCYIYATCQAYRAEADFQHSPISKRTAYVGLNSLNL